MGRQGFAAGQRNNSFNMLRAHDFYSSCCYVSCCFPPCLCMVLALQARDLYEKACFCCFLANVFDVGGEGSDLGQATSGSAVAHSGPGHLAASGTMPRHATSKRSWPLTKPAGLRFSPLETSVGKRASPDYSQHSGPSTSLAGNVTSIPKS